MHTRTYMYYIQLKAKANLILFDREYYQDERLRGIVLCYFHRYLFYAYVLSYCSLITDSLVKQFPVLLFEKRVKQQLFYYATIAF